MAFQIEAYLLQALASAPQGSNPYLVLSRGILDLLPGPYPQNFKYQLYALSGTFVM